MEDEHVLLSVRRDGLVEWKLPRIFSTFCVVDVTYYPFDTQKCVIEVSSWVYTIQELALLPAKSSANYEDIRSVIEIFGEQFFTALICRLQFCTLSESQRSLCHSILI